MSRSMKKGGRELLSVLLLFALVFIRFTYYGLKYYPQLDDYLHYSIYTPQTITADFLTTRPLLCMGKLLGKHDRGRFDPLDSLYAGDLSADARIPAVFLLRLDVPPHRRAASLGIRRTLLDLRFLADHCRSVLCQPCRPDASVLL